MAPGRLVTTQNTSPWEASNMKLGSLRTRSRGFAAEDILGGRNRSELECLLIAPHFRTADHMTPKLSRGWRGTEPREPRNTFRTHSSDPPYVLGQCSEPIAFRINLMLNLGDLSDMFFRFGWLKFTTCECRRIFK
jgi:hypothetical protein